MSNTKNLNLPLLAAAQAQKHVTHNEALAVLDALVQLAVIEQGRTVAPTTPAEGDRYLVGAGATGAFAGHEGEIAFFDLGAWRFLTPGVGWRIYDEAQDKIFVFDGALWHDLGHYCRDIENLDRLGVGTAVDDLNRLAAKLNATLFTARTVAEGGTGDLRFVLNKSEKANVLSQLYQDGYSGRAETGLIGTDDYKIRVSPDGEQWRDAVSVDCQTGVATFPYGVSLGQLGAGVNLLMNGNFLVNQRGFLGGVLSAGSFGFDRWKGGAGGCTLVRDAAGKVTLTGSLEQGIDVALAASLIEAVTFAGQTMTLSVEEPSSPLAFSLGSKSATIPAGSGRRSATVTLGAGDTGNIVLKLSPGSTCSFKRIKLEIGAVATPWIAEQYDVEEYRCRRYYQRLYGVGTTTILLPFAGQRISTNIIDVPVFLPVPMRSAPALRTSGFTWVAAAPINNQIGYYDNAGLSWVNLTGDLSATPLGGTTATGFILRLQATTFGGAAGTSGYLHLGSGAAIAAQAEI
ncbi:DUF2793 domain-containing protein [Microvirga flavescens]|uniref:DUF2793 domain-containing protein n=1 Tax=Microvirga flavescens TaxID=2249811 RepID=UPI000DDA364C|nr:DUF2793 domain-containing protein [Microvirga flavescens]